MFCATVSSPNSAMLKHLPPYEFVPSRSATNAAAAGLPQSCVSHAVADEPMPAAQIYQGDLRCCHQIKALDEGILGSWYRHRSA